MSVIDEIRQENEDLARVLKKKPGIRRIVEDLYPDSAHFIYELLQNAEDTGATAAQFVLSETALAFVHNGRPFEPRDIEGITSIGEGTKAEDEDKIGQFGIGFKAVFAFSESPHIWSTDFSFRITELVLPYELESRPDIGDSTRFEFPFNNPKKPAPAAYAETDNGLSLLAETTLLFLRNLESICWENATGVSGEILRLKHSEHHYEMLKQIDGKTTASRHFLKFDEPVVGLGHQRAAVAFELDYAPKVDSYDSRKPLAEQLKIVPANHGQVAVSFPAEKETSGLRFHLHAPFVPELSRASVKETPANLPLFEQLARLAASSLHAIKGLHLLSGEFLAVLPNSHDSLPPRYQGIRDAIIGEMNHQPLTPTQDKGHAPAKVLVNASATMKALLTSTDLAFLLDRKDEALQWAISASQRNSNADRFLAGLAVTPLDFRGLVAALTAKPVAALLAWLSDKASDWHQRFYAFLWASLAAQSNRAQIVAAFKSLIIVRRSDGSYARGQDCYFPSDGDGDGDCGDESDFAFVDPSIYTSGDDKEEQEAARRVLKEIGVREVSEADQVEAILKKRYRSPGLFSSIADLKRFVALVERDSSSPGLFKPYFIFKRKDGKWGQPGQVFLDQPFLDTGLSPYYEALAADSSPVALADDYEDCGVTSAQLVKFAVAVGVIIKLEAQETQCHGNPQWLDLQSAPGTWITDTGTDRDYVIPGLKEILSRQSEAISGLVWRTMRDLPDSSNCFTATYRRNRSNDARTAASQLVHQLREVQWIPQGDGVFVRPIDAHRERLPAGFPFDPGWRWIKAIQFGKGSGIKAEADRQKQAVAKNLGFDSVEEIESFRQLKATGFSVSDYLAQFARTRAAVQPEEATRDPVRRRRNVLENAEDAPSNESVQRERSVQVGVSEVTAQAKAYLRAKYTNSDKQLVCQCCHQEMPFRLPSGDHYFEAVQCIQDTEVLHFQNRLALCPTCAAMYLYARETDDETVLSSIVDHPADDQAPSIEIAVRLAGQDKTLRFVGTHWFDLKTVLTRGTD